VSQHKLRFFGSASIPAKSIITLINLRDLWNCKAICRTLEKFDLYIGFKQSELIKAFKTLETF